MCGIDGLITPSSQTFQSHELAKMRDVLVHRGPDSRGLWVQKAADCRVGLAHQRLSILDHEGGHQPMVTPDENIGVVFNGQFTITSHFVRN